MSEDTTTDPAKPADAAGGGTGQMPDPSAPEGNGDTPKLDEATLATIRTLRKEAADNRKAREAVEVKLRELEDRDKSEAEKLAARAAESERRAVDAEAHLLRLEVAASRGMKASAVPLLRGDTREEIEATADALADFAKDNEQAPSGFDGGARGAPAEQQKSPEAAHSELLMKALGRTP